MAEARLGARRAKIVCTIGPASADEAILDRLIGAGMNVARINMSHGTHDSAAQTIARVRGRAERRGVHVAVLLDLQGPKMRTGPLAGGGPVLLAEGAEFAITTRPVQGTAAEVSTGYAGLPADVSPGDRVLLSDGLIELRVGAVTEDTVQCRVVNGGRLFERQGINLPGVLTAAPSLTEKDRDDLAWGIGQGVDYVAVSFVRRAGDLVAARDQLRAAGATIPLIAKLEKPQALEHLDAILDASDGVMVARGDMGVELPPEEVPGWQKRIIRAANARSLPVITATQMLESMVHNPRPTRAEATDVANAVWDGTDAVMLSAETAAGEYPVQAVAMMDRIVRAAEQEWEFAHALPVGTAAGNVPHALAAAARAAGTALGSVRAIVAFTRSGDTARLVSHYRPPAPIIAVAENVAVARRMALSWGVYPYVSADPIDSLEAALREAEEAARALGLAAAGDDLLVLGHLPVDAPGSTNLMTVHRMR